MSQALVEGNTEIQGETLRFKGNKTNWFPKRAVIKCFVRYPIQKIAACFSKKVFLLFKLYNYHYIHQQKPPGHEFTLGTGSSFVFASCVFRVGMPVYSYAEFFCKDCKDTKMTAHLIFAGACLNRETGANLWRHLTLFVLCCLWSLDWVNTCFFVVEFQASLSLLNSPLKV